MTLVDVWYDKPEEIKSKNISQIISWAGEGHLRDGSITSQEIRELLRVIDSTQLSTFASQCMEDSSNSDTPFVFQDIINESGRRLGFQVEPGLYKGIRGGDKNYDGLWKSEDGFSIMVEVKSTDTYTVELEKLSDYVEKLSNDEKVKEEKTSILIVVGKASTEALEQQIRGSKYAWDIRLISASSLLSLVKVKENLDTIDTEQKILSVLRPHEYTRIDEIVDLVFSVTEDFKAEDNSKDETVEEAELIIEGKNKNKLSESKNHKHDHPIKFYEKCVDVIQKKERWNLIRKSRSAWMSTNGDKLIIILNSKEYNSENKPNYWFGLHKNQLDRLKSVKDSYLALGCGSADQILIIPRSYVESILPKLSTTTREEGTWWHFVVVKSNEGEMYLEPKRPYENENLSKFILI
jgi:hypothetical protein